MRNLAAAFLALALLFPSTAARANEREWYGWQIMIADTASFLLATKLPEAALLGYAFGGPFIHLAHQDAAEAFLDLGVRIGMPAIGGVIASTSTSCGEDCEIPPAFGGIVIGAAVAMVTDYALLSTHERVTVAPTPGGAVLSVWGTF